MVHGQPGSRQGLLSLSGSFLYCYNNHLIFLEVPTLPSGLYKVLRESPRKAGLQTSVQWLHALDHDRELGWEGLRRL